VGRPPAAYARSLTSSPVQPAAVSRPRRAPRRRPAAR
jgi:hypothetical protein